MGVCSGTQPRLVEGRGGAGLVGLVVAGQGVERGGGSVAANRCVGTAVRPRRISLQLEQCRVSVAEHTGCGEASGGCACLGLAPLLCFWINRGQLRLSDRAACPRELLPVHHLGCVQPPVADCWGQDKSRRQRWAGDGSAGAATKPLWMTTAPRWRRCHKARLRGTRRT